MTVPQLKALLNDRNVTIPQSANKSDLIQLLEEDK
ncbi:HeH/LEM domain-containing protein [Enterococcus sp. AZ103]